jgi:hypothetical protein
MFHAVGQGLQRQLTRGAQAMDAKCAVNPFEPLLPGGGHGGSLPAA